MCGLLLCVLVVLCKVIPAIHGNYSPCSDVANKSLLTLLPSHFMHAKEQREQEKDSQVRYQKFLKTTYKTNSATTNSNNNPTVLNASYNNNQASGNYYQNHSNTQTSGAFGGKPKTHRGANKAKRVVPAWNLGNEEFQSDQKG